MKISILLATYNGEDYLNEQISSIIKNIKRLPEHNFVIEVADDNSSDNTVSILEGFAKEFDFIKLKFKSRVGGALQNFSRLIKNSESADIYFFCDQDDIWFERKIENYITIYNKKNRDVPLLIYSDLTLVDKFGNVIHDSMFKFQSNYINPSLSKMLLSNSATGCTMACNRSLFNLIKESHIENSIMHDWYICLYAKVYGEIYFLDEATVYYRQHDKNVIGASNNNFFHLIKSKRFSSKKYRNSLSKCRDQASLFLVDNKNTLDSSDLSTVVRFIEDLDGGVVRRVYAFLAGRIRKKGFTKSVGLFIFYVLGMVI